MALLTFQNGSVETSINHISATLSDLKVSIGQWPVSSKRAQTLLSREKLSDHDKDLILRDLQEYFLDLQKRLGYRTQDMIVLHPDIEGLEKMLAKFSVPHTHDDDEVRYIVDGEGVFGFVLSDKKQVELKVEAGEYINIPAGVEHWFRLTSKSRIKAIRYFTSTEGWEPNYTDTEILVPRESDDE